MIVSVKIMSDIIFSMSYVVIPTSDVVFAVFGKNGAVGVLR